MQGDSEAVNLRTSSLLLTPSVDNLEPLLVGGFPPKKEGKKINLCFARETEGVISQLRQCC